MRMKRFGTVMDLSMAMNASRLPSISIPVSSATVQNSQPLQMNANSAVKDAAKLNYNA